MSEDVEDVEPTCEECAEAIEADASKCPHCGHAPAKKAYWSGWTWIFVGLCATIFGVVFPPVMIVGIIMIFIGWSAKRGSKKMSPTGS